jgi:hypothetical protein
MIAFSLSEAIGVCLECCINCCTFHLYYDTVDPREGWYSQRKGWTGKGRHILV